MEGVLRPSAQDPASLQLWPQPSFVLAKFSGHHGGKMAISPSGFPGGGTARESPLLAVPVQGLACLSGPLGVTYPS